MKMKLAALTILLLASSIFATTYVHVTVSGAGSGDGTDWSNAMPEPNFYDTITNGGAANDTTYYIAQGSYALTGNVVCLPAGTATAPVKFIGVKTGTTHEGAAVVYTDYAFTTSRPSFSFGTYKWTTEDYYSVQNIIASSSADTTSDTMVSGSHNSFINCLFTNASTTANLAGLYTGTNDNVEGCEAVSTKGYGFRIYAGNMLTNCYAHDCSTSGRGFNITSNYNTLVSCISDTNTNGIIFSGYGIRVTGCVIYNCTTGISGLSTYDSAFINNIISQCTTGASWTTEEPLNYWAGNLWNNTTDTSNVTKGLTDISLDVGTQCMNAPATGDFTLTYATAKNAGIGITTNEGVSTALAKPNIGVDQNDVSLYTLTSGMVWPTEEQVTSGVDFGPTGADYTGTAEELDPNSYVLKSQVVNVLYVLSGNATYPDGPTGVWVAPNNNYVWNTQTYGVASGTHGAMHASDIPLDPNIVVFGETVDDVTGAYVSDCNDYIDPGDVVDPNYVLYGHDNYVGGSPGTLTLPANGNKILDTETPFGVVGSLISGLYNGPEAAEVWNEYTFGLNDGVSGTFHASDITVTNGDAATLTAPDILDGIVVDDVTGTATAGSGSGMSSAWVGSNPQ